MLAAALKGGRVFDLDAYFSRIGYAGPRDPTLSTLRALQALHAAAIPFENLDPLLGRPVPLDVPALQRKMLGSQRGGYCFEQNTLFRAVLEALGFAVTSLVARVVWAVPPEGPPNPRAHMLLMLDIAGERYIADVGFGGWLLPAPLLLVPEVEQPMWTSAARLRHSGEFFTLQGRLTSGWQDFYRFTLEPQYPVDYEMANWFTSTHPTSIFLGNLLVERLTPEFRLSLFNRRLTRRHADGRVEEQVLTSAAELSQVLTAEFLLAPSVDEAKLFARLPVA
jgi:N-hydroxyarylamine O-acetyltransferase